MEGKSKPNCRGPKKRSSLRFVGQEIDPDAQACLGVNPCGPFVPVSTKFKSQNPIVPEQGPCEKVVDSLIGEYNIDTLGRLSMPKTIAVVDDDPDILELVSLHLQKNRYQVREFADASGFLGYLKNENPNLVILDLMLPDGDGFEICKFMKKDDRFASIPLIMLTARADETDKILGLELGADDYVTKPFSPKELVARVKAVLRRTEAPREAAERLSVSGILTIDPSRFEVMAEGARVDLTSTEFRILHLLARNQGRVLSREKILDHLWGNEKIVIDRTVDVHIKHLRQKLGPAGQMIRNVRGMGYKLE